MGLESLALAKTNEFPIRHEGDVHSGKVRSVYWLTKDDSRRLIEQRGYAAHPSTQLGAMVISDKISAFDCNWKGEDGLAGVPGKGAALNAISNYWFNQFNEMGLAGNHILDTPHPLVWIVQRAKPIMVEAIARDYITGSMWRAYEKGAREFCGIKLPDNLQNNQRLPQLLITPSTKGIMRGIPGVPEEDDTNITRDQILANYAAFGFMFPKDVEKYEERLVRGFDLISRQLQQVGDIFVDTKFEFGYIKTPAGETEMIYMDEVGTPDSSRYWGLAEYKRGEVVEKSKEEFRKELLARLDRNILLDSKRMPERKALAGNYRVPVDVMMKMSDIYRSMTEKITNSPLAPVQDAPAEIMQVMSQYGLAA
jgi:phosphoribosylaminoimidazole-succinocarboxamide synthase